MRWLRRQYQDISGNAKWDAINTVCTLFGGGGVMTVVTRTIVSLWGHPADMPVTVLILVVSVALLYFGLVWKRLEPDEERLPGFSVCAIITLLTNASKRRKYIFDFGGVTSERLSVYISSNSIFTLSFIDASNEPHLIQLPLGSKIPFGREFILGCELGITGESTIMRVHVNGSVVGELKLGFRADIGGLDIPNSVIGANLLGEDCGSFKLGPTGFARTTIAQGTFSRFKTYFDAKGEKSLAEFNGKWVRASSLEGGISQPPSPQLPLTPSPEADIVSVRSILHLSEGKFSLNLSEKNERGSWNMYGDQNENRSWSFDPVRRGVFFATKTASGRVVYAQGPLRVSQGGVHRVIITWNAYGGSLHVDGEGREDFEPPPNTDKPVA